MYWKAIEWSLQIQSAEAKVSLRAEGRAGQSIDIVSKEPFLVRDSVAIEWISRLGEFDIAIKPQQHQEDDRDQ